MKAIRIFLIGLVLVGLAVPAVASTFTQSGAAIVGEDPNFEPDVTANFDIIEEGSILQITLTNNSSAEFAIGQVLTGLYWDSLTASVLTVDTALVGEFSTLVGYSSIPQETDLSSEWAFKDDVSAGTLGSFGISAVGDILLGADTFGANDRFDTTTNLYPPPSGSLNGIEGGIVGPDFIDPEKAGFQNQGPLVQNEMIFRLFINGEALTMDDIYNVQFTFGTDGAPPIPEPTSAVLLFAGLLVAGKAIRRAPAEV